MKPVTINPSLGTVKEKFYGFELRQIADIALGTAASLAVALLIPDSFGFVKGMLASLVAVPFVLVAVKDFYGLKGLALAKAVLRFLINSRPLVFTTKYRSKKGRVGL